MSTTVELVRANERYARLRAAVEKLHQSDDGEWCEHDGFSWPCATTRALLAAVDS